MSKLFTLPSIIPAKLNHFLPLTAMSTGTSSLSLLSITSTPEHLHIIYIYIGFHDSGVGGGVLFIKARVFSCSLKYG